MRSSESVNIIGAMLSSKEWRKRSSLSDRTIAAVNWANRNSLTVCRASSARLSNVVAPRIKVHDRASNEIIPTWMTTVTSTPPTETATSKGPSIVSTVEGGFAGVAGNIEVVGHEGISWEISQPTRSRGSAPRARARDCPAKATHDSSSRTSRSLRGRTRRISFQREPSSRRLLTRLSLSFATSLDEFY